MSTSSGAVLHATTLREALRLAAIDILQLPLRLDLALNTLIAELKDHQVAISTFGPCNITKTVQLALNKNGASTSIDQEVLLDHKPAAPLPEELIAVVGMAGRFPDGDTLETFWEVIKAGRDVHKSVGCHQRIQYEGR